MTLIEVMAAVLVVMVIVIGVMNFQFYCALDARKADVRVTAARLGQLLLEAWKTVEGDVLLYDPAADFGEPPLDDFSVVADPGLPGLATSFRIYRIKINGTNYFVKLSYEDATAPRTLSAAIAWSRQWSSDTLDFEPRRLVRLTKYANYPPP